MYASSNGERNSLKDKAQFVAAQDGDAASVLTANARGARAGRRARRFK
jgi:hypothetical protein